MNIFVKQEHHLHLWSFSQDCHLDVEFFGQRMWTFWGLLTHIARSFSRKVVWFYYSIPTIPIPAFSLYPHWYCKNKMWNAWHTVLGTQQWPNKWKLMMLSMYSRLCLALRRGAVLVLLWCFGFSLSCIIWMSRISSLCPFCSTLLRDWWANVINFFETGVRRKMTYSFTHTDFQWVVLAL